MYQAAPASLSGQSKIARPFNQHMDNAVKKIVMLSVILMAGCQNEATRTPEPSTEASEQPGTATLIVISKEAKLGESGFNLIDNDKTLLSYMKISKTIEFQLPSGSRTFTVSSTGSPGFKLQANLKPDTKTCMQIETNNANYLGKFILPFMRNATPTHRAELIPCELKSAT
ncbi:hypothetical protein OH686_01400 [Pseudomonas sp. SO81]|nr:hypothetical protein OH686_01400 [Pseudomonas sp. SO81]